MTSDADSPCVIVLHEVWGPDANIDTACKRLRKLGFATSTPALYKGHEAVLTTRNIKRAMDAVWDLSLEERRDKEKVAAAVAKARTDARARKALSVLYDQRFRDGMLEAVIDAIGEARKTHSRVGTLGFSLGGGLSLASAMRPGHPDAAVAFCGEPPKPDAIRSTSTPMLAVCANHDELMNPLMPRFVESALEFGLDLTVKILPGTEHGFFNEKMKERYDRAAAQEAWGLVTGFLANTLHLSKR